MAPSLGATLTLLALAPFLAAILAPLVHRFAGALAGWILALVPAGICLVLASFVAPVAAGGPVAGELGWIPSLGLALAFRVDGLSLVFALLISGIGALVLIYSGTYLKAHPHQGRFFAFMLLFMGAMLGLVLADNAVALYGFWELTSVASFLLIGFDHGRQAARRAAIQALAVTGLGGLALLAGLVLAAQAAGGDWSIPAILALGPGFAAHGLYPAVLLLVLLGAFTKSAQWPFHFWLPNAMEAPTPVSAYLHSATMVQAGIYLLARFSPLLGGTGAWTTVLVVVGGFTLLWGSVAALRQTDLKLMLAQTTLASLGLLVLLLGIGGETAILAMALYFIAHALYKAGLFLVAGTVDHETGIRDITALGGLARRMPVSFAAAGLAAFSMVGLPLSLGFFGKEEMYLALAGGRWDVVAVLAVLVLGNALLGAVAIVFVLRPFLGPRPETPKTPQEGRLALAGGPLLLGLAGIAGAVFAEQFGHDILAPMAAAITGEAAAPHLRLVPEVTQPAFWLSVLTWALAAAAAWRADLVRKVLRRVADGAPLTFDRGFDGAMFGLVRLAGAVTRFWHHGRLELYLVAMFAMLALALLWPLLGLRGLPERFALPELTFHEWFIFALAAIGVVAVPLSPTRLMAILALGVQGFAVAVIFMLFGAPDLSFTQFMVEVLSVVILALVMTKLKLDQRDPRQFEDILRDGGLALACGAGIFLLLAAVLAVPLDPRLGDFFAATSVPLAHGHNIVNVILVDYRGLDTLGEISVVMAAGIAILGLVRRQIRPLAPTPAPKPRARRPRREVP